MRGGKNYNAQGLRWELGSQRKSKGLDLWERKGGDHEVTKPGWAEDRGSEERS